MFFCKDFCWSSFLADGASFGVALALYVGLRFVQPGLTYFSPTQERTCLPLNILEKVVSVVQLWVWFKLAHLAAYFELIRVIQNKKKYLNALCLVCFFTANIIFDIPMQLFERYTLWMYVAFWAVAVQLAVIAEGLAIGLSAENIGLLAFNGLLMACSYGVPAACILLLNPLIFEALEGFGGRLAYLYLFPVMVFLLEVGLRVTLRLAMPRVKPFIAQAHWLLYGFRFGFLLRVSFYETEFYYVVLFMCIENVMLAWLNQFTLFRESSEPPLFVVGWLAAFLLAFYSDYNPVQELLGQLVSATACKLQFDWRLKYLVPVSNYVEYTEGEYLGSRTQGLVASLVFWGLYLPTRRYRLSDPSPMRVLYYSMGLYLFFGGMTVAARL